MYQLDTAGAGDLGSAELIQDIEPAKESCLNTGHTVIMQSPQGGAVCFADNVHRAAHLPTI